LATARASALLIEKSAFVLNQECDELRRGALRMSIALSVIGGI
jgi:hypothetical protein